MSLFSQLEFVTTVDHLRDLPPPTAGVEVAFVGRSNAGKSSAINALARRKRMAFVSKTPGRTRHINYFRVRPGAFLVDLPGYGYARASESARLHWVDLIEGYLASRENLRGLILIMDIRHALTDLDRQLLDWFLPSGRPVHVLLNKSDKLTRQQAQTTLRRVEAILAAE
jgi:GTP-binding protein